jgi:hypothetical protein
MKRIAMAAPMAHLAVSSVSAEDRSTNVRMTASGTMTATTINLQDNTITDDEDLAGDVTLGVFTFHGLRADALAPQTPELPPHEKRRCFSQLSTGRASFALMTEVSWS